MSDEAEKTLRVHGISVEDYQAWRHQSVTKVILKFLADKQEHIKQTALSGWLDGNQTFADINQTVRGQIIEIQEMIDLPFEAIIEFYKSQEEDNEPSAESPVSTSR